MQSFLKMKHIANLIKTCCYFFENEAGCACLTVQKYFIPKMFIMRFNTDIVSLRKSIIVQHFYAKTRLSQGLLSDVELLKQMFTVILDMKNADRVHNQFFK